MSPIISLLITFLPTIVALLRRHRNCLAIGVLNLVAIIPVFWAILNAPTILFGLILLVALIPWVIALVWACTANTHRAVDKAGQSAPLTTPATTPPTPAPAGPRGWWSPEGKGHP